MRSGNHAIIEWILHQYSGHAVCFLNNVAHGDHDPYATCRQRVLHGIDANIDEKTLRRMQKRLLVFSYEDRLDAERPDMDFIDSVFSPEFREHRTRYVGTSRTALDVLVIRDPFNCIASRLKLLESRGPMGGATDMERVVANWKRLAARAIAFMANPDPGTVVARFNQWVADQRYREELSRLLGGRYTDSSMRRMSRFGGGSSFDAPAPAFAALSRTQTPLATRTAARWTLYRHAEVFRGLMRDPTLLELSERLFGELPGTRDFVRSLQAHVRSGA